MSKPLVSINSSGEDSASQQVVHQRHDDNDVPLGVKILSACAGSFVTSMIVTPLDVVKVRLQAETVSMPASSGMIRRCQAEPQLSIYAKSLGLRRDQHGKMRCDRLVYCSRLFDHVEPLPSPKCSTVYFKQNGFAISTLMEKSSVLFGLRQIVRQDGVLGLWRGLMPTLFMAVPATTVYFIGYETMRSHAGWTARPELGYLAPIVCGASARTLAVCVISPLELIRTRLQSSSVSSFTFWRDVHQMVQSKGVKSLWKGLIPTLWRDVPFSAVYWFMYERTKRSVMASSLMSGSQNRNAMASFISGCFSGMIAATLTTPLDVVKTRRQVQGMTLSGGTGPGASSSPVFRCTESSTGKILASLWKEAGLKGLFKGKCMRCHNINNVMGCDVRVNL